MGLAFILSVVVASSTISANEKDSRVLRIVDNGVTTELALPQLLSGIEVLTADIDDSVFGGNKKYSALPLLEVLKIAGVKDLSKYVEIKFVCADGYTVTANAHLFRQKNAQPLLAINALGVAQENLINPRWERYQQGSNVISFDPFYLVWQLNTAEFTHKSPYPWPYQLTQIELLREYTVPDIAPADSAEASVKAGYKVFSSQCMRCHQVRGVGGTLGPELTRLNGMLKVLSKKELKMLVKDVRQFYPQSAMPVFNEVLTDDEIHSVVEYLHTL